MFDKREAEHRVLFENGATDARPRVARHVIGAARFNGSSFVPSKKSAA
jgi:hypothetical protein